ncbi:YbaB/EbfC family nucleoid-associated protein [Sediminibacillus dalangtanensis]|uniref:Nucleoid-associated protein ERJ70_19250 n=1 Tax=Sediminibacillus dalangtanensis TaxID=2729421 RepID=A0ABX7VXG0_9BACI|nr:YbaB/EbfC family nucleoid-associated protein [Sediminibacillus dalangtanensis]QTN01229.1 YbaB/EbfC family nucleoid-associated protein [Sediminibacillus dalangtanensis]
MRGGGNMNKMMKQMQKMQKDMMKAQEELQEMSFEGTAGGGMVKVTANGKKEITDIQLNEEVVDPDDLEMLQDLILAATNDVLKQVEDKTNDTMGQFTKGLNMPGGMF